MAKTAERTRFNRLDNSVLGPGLTTEYRDAHGYTLAFMDYHSTDLKAAVTVFNPATGGSRHYDFRELAPALAIVRRHVAAQGYEMP